MAHPQAHPQILDFWFGAATDPHYGQPRKAWFIKNPDFDQQIRDRFLQIYRCAANGELQSWQDQPLPCLALVILLDQFPRNLFRGQPQAFATDPLALATARQGVERGFDHQLLPVQRWFLYLPFEHSEDLADQQRSVDLFQQLDPSDPENANCLDYARRHLAVIQRFGRFPHRNSILNRPSTPEEIEFLKQPGSAF